MKATALIPNSLERSLREDYPELKGWLNDNRSQLTTEVQYYSNRQLDNLSRYQLPLEEYFEEPPIDEPEVYNYTRLYAMLVLINTIVKLLGG